MRYWISIDWGTTNFRAYLLDETNQLVDQMCANCGLLSVPQGKFEQVLFDHLAKWSTQISLSGTPIYMAGMVGAKQGWQEVEYLSTPLPLTKIADHLFPLLISNNFKAFIVAGLSAVNSFGFYDVMRGEETQLLGLAKLIQDDDFKAILPGTHSKHTVVRQGVLQSFTTVMTGELFALLDQHSLLTKQTERIYDHQASFLQGVEKGFQYPLNGTLFSARTLMLNGELNSSKVRSYLSGLLIGNEIQLLDKNKRIYIVGSENISKQYSIALQHLNYDARIFSGEQCFLAGMQYIRQINKDRE